MLFKVVYTLISWTPLFWDYTGYVVYVKVWIDMEALMKSEIFVKGVQD